MDNFPERLRKESGVFLVEIDRIKPNTMQPRQVFDEAKLAELAESIKQYGVLQPLVVIRHEKEVPEGAIVEYELIAGERRCRASVLAGLTQVPVVVREEPSERVKLELALIENLQREDLGPLERAEAFKQLVDDFKLRHHEVGRKIGKSREFVSNTIRLLVLPNEIKEGLRQGLINEGHTRPLMSLVKQKDEQMVLYKEIIYRKMTVREAEQAGREIVKKYNLRSIKREFEDPETLRLEKHLSDCLKGARVSVENKGAAKKISFEFWSDEELQNFLSKLGAMGVGVSGETENIATENGLVENEPVVGAEEIITPTEVEEIAEAVIENNLEQVSPEEIPQADQLDNGEIALPVLEQAVKKEEEGDSGQNSPASDETNFWRRFSI